VTGGVWVGASHVLGRPVPVDEPFPHVCGVDVTGTMTRRQFRLWARDCGACAEKRAPARPEAGAA
jgi:hypothetical protein